MVYRLHLRQGTSTDASDKCLILGEVAYLVDTEELVAGNPKVEKGYSVVAKVVPNEDDRLFASLENHDCLIPLCIKRGRVV